MNNIEIIKDSFGNEHIIIKKNETEFTSMLKSTYDAMQAEDSTPILSEGGN